MADRDVLELALRDLREGLERVQDLRRRLADEEARLALTRGFLAVYGADERDEAVTDKEICSGVYATASFGYAAEARRTGSMESSVRRTACALGLYAVFLVLLVVVTLPGTTSASIAPDPSPPPEQAAAPAEDGGDTSSAMLLEAGDPGQPGSSDLAQVEAPDVAPPADPLLFEQSERELLAMLGLEFDLLAESFSALAEGSAPASVLEGAQVISIYGYPGICFMGELGCHEPADAVPVVRDLAAQYQALNDERGTGRTVLPAFHLIVDVAQPRPQPDGSYLFRMPEERIAEYVELAREQGLLLFLDIQVGWTDPLEAAQRLEPFLVEPFVHLAIDPEFATESRGKPPGSVIGSLDGIDVNRVQTYLAELVWTHGLPPKVLVLHQFLPSMLTSTDIYEDVPGVEISVDMDGFGAPPEKIGGYYRYAVSDYSRRPAFKLFFHWDVPLMLPRDVMDLSSPPDYVIYQ